MFGASGNSRSANALVCKKLNVFGNKFTHLIFAAQFADARPADLIFLANARKAKFYFVEFAGIQKMPMCLSAFFWHFSMLALTR